MKFRMMLVLLVLGSLTACQSLTDRTTVSVGFYDVKGTSFAEIDQGIQLHGPKVAGVGNAIAATSIQFFPDVQFAQVRPDRCQVIKSNIRVNAKVTLPRLTDRKNAERKIQGAFSNFEDYARKHEAVHVGIADNHARQAERAIRALKARASCQELQDAAKSIFKAILDSHEAAQKKFDADEQARFAQLASDTKSNRSKVLTR